MLEHSIYSVISPEGCAAILWRNANQAETAAEALKLTAQDLLGLGLIDEIIAEPLGGAHRGRSTTIESVGDGIERHLAALEDLSPADIRHNRREKYLHMGRELE
jgi:acetyl-CoA carboxylase carboxyl transferase subunit alpha